MDIVHVTAIVTAVSSAVMAIVSVLRYRKDK